MKKPENLYGVYNLDGASRNFFFKEEDAKEFKNQEENRFGPEVFPFWNAYDQFRIELNADGAREPKEEEFLRVLYGEEIDFYDLDDRLEPSEGYFEDINEGLLWLRASASYILIHMNEYASERDYVIEDFDYYDDLFRILKKILNDYFEDIEDFERLIENLYDGVDDMESEDDSDLDIE